MANQKSFFLAGFSVMLDSLCFFYFIKIVIITQARLQQAADKSDTINRVKFFIHLQDLGSSQLADYLENETRARASVSQPLGLFSRICF